MSDTTVTVDFIGRRLDSVQGDQPDLRRRMISLAERFSAIEGRIGAVEHRIGGLENRMSATDERIDLVIDRLHRIEAMTETRFNRLEQMLGDILAKLA